MSHWNGYPDFQKLRGAGMRFVFSKASQGTSFQDDTYLRHTREARNAGLLAGAYHFFDYRRDGVRQARHFLDTLRKSTGLEGLLPLVVDVETLPSLGTPDKVAAKRRLHALLDELYRQTGRYPMIYTSQYMWRQVVGQPTTFGRYPLWVACWRCDTIHLPRGWTGWRFWQVGLFRFNGGVRLDGNVYSANMTKLRTEKERPVRLDDGARFATARTSQADLRGLDGKEVRVAVGGEPFGPWRPYSPRFDLSLSEAQGEQQVRVQLRSFRNVTSPVFREDIILDSIAPSISGPTVGIRQGSRVAQNGKRVPAAASMSATDATSGLESSFLRTTCDGVQRVGVQGRPAGTAESTFQLDRSGCTVSGRARDVAGNTRNKGHSPRVALLDIRAGVDGVLLRGDWKVSRQRTSLRRSLATTSAGGALARIRFEGAQFAVVARRGPAGGLVDVVLDGEAIDTIDLYADAVDQRRIVYTRNVPRGQHTLRLRATGTGSAKSSGAVVWLDAILVLDRRRP